MSTVKNCFVIIGYGIKTDLATGRALNLENTYLGLIKPVFDDLGIDCFRAKDIIHTGIIDKPMYEWILKADIVLADISTLNPNVLYELGIRHALKPYSTIVISEDKLDKLPFDLGHLIIDPMYHHLGEDIGIQEAKKFTQSLKSKIQNIIKKPLKDSPVYTFLDHLEAPKFSDIEIDEIKSKLSAENSLSKLIDEGEIARKNCDYDIAKACFTVALKFNKNDSFITQRLTLVTYKDGKPSKLEALNQALDIISVLLPEESTDPETLGLCGAIYKRKYELTGNYDDLDKAIWFYERGYYIKQDYYNSINAAFLYTLRSTIQTEREESITDFKLANRIREKVISICNKIINNDNFNERRDKNWIYFTLSEAYLGIGNHELVKANEDLGKKYSEGPFDVESYSSQKSKLVDLIWSYNKIIN